jgi:hypothetical protein
MNNKVAARHDRTAFDDFGHVCLRPQVKELLRPSVYRVRVRMIGTCRFPVLERGHRTPHDLVNDPLAGPEPAMLSVAHLEPGARAALAGVLGVSAVDIQVRGQGS